MKKAFPMLLSLLLFLSMTACTAPDVKEPETSSDLPSSNQETSQEVDTDTPPETANPELKVSIQALDSGELNRIYEDGFGCGLDSGDRILWVGPSHILFVAEKDTAHRIYLYNTETDAMTLAAEVEIMGAYNHCTLYGDGTYGYAYFSREQLGVKVDLSDGSAVTQTYENVEGTNFYPSSRETYVQYIMEEDDVRFAVSPLDDPNEYLSLFPEPGTPRQDFVSWSPNERYILTERHVEGEDGEPSKTAHAVYQSDGELMVEFETEGETYLLGWSPSGESLFLHRYEEGRTSYWCLSIKTGEEFEILDVSPASQEVLFLTEEYALTYLFGGEDYSFMDLSQGLNTSLDPAWEEGMNLPSGYASPYGPQFLLIASESESPYSLQGYLLTVE